MTPQRGSVRRQVRIARSPAEVWKVLGDPARIQEWFPGVLGSTVEGSTRVLTTASGIPMVEEILTNDPLQHRFQYRLTAPSVREHLSSLDVLDLGDGTSLVIYSADAVPATMALVIAGAAGNALEHLRDLLEGGYG